VAVSVAVTVAVAVAVWELSGNSLRTLWGLWMLCWVGQGGWLG